VGRVKKAREYCGDRVGGRAGDAPGGGPACRGGSAGGEFIIRVASCSRATKVGERDQARHLLASLIARSIVGERGRGAHD
jgi:hypothetical protein